MIRRLCFGIVFLLFFTSMAHAEMVSIKTSKARIRSGPGVNHPIKFELGTGYPLRVVSRKGNWLKVTDYESDTGWISKTLVSKNPHLIVKTEKTVIRTGPGTHQRVVGNAKRGVVLQTLKHQKGWVQIKHESGLIGWIQRDTLWGW